MQLVQEFTTSTEFLKWRWKLRQRKIKEVKEFNPLFQYAGAIIREIRRVWVPGKERAKISLDDCLLEFVTHEDKKQAAKPKELTEAQKQVQLRQSKGFWSWLSGKKPTAPKPPA